MGQQKLNFKILGYPEEQTIDPFFGFPFVRLNGIMKKNKQKQNRAFHFVHAQNWDFQAGYFVILCCMSHCSIRNNVWSRTKMRLDLRCKK